jgi:hypothetical protein
MGLEGISVIDGPQTTQEWKEHSVSYDLWSIETACERILAAGARASLMILLEKIIREHKLDRFSREAAE